MKNTVFPWIRFVITNALGLSHPSIEVLIEYIALVQRGDITIEARREILIEQRELLVARMKEMQNTLDILDHKIEVSEKAVLRNEKELIPIED